MLDDLLKPTLRVVFCGTAASARSAKLRQYYAGQGNKFWRVLREVGLTDKQLKPAEYRQLLRYGIGLTDVVKKQSGADQAIDFRKHQCDTLRMAMLTYSPSVLCFNGKKAASVFLGPGRREYGLQRERIGHTRIFIAPSTSGAASGSWSVTPWRRLARLVA